MSEELRDEHINKKLNEAFQMKQQNQNDEALKIYLEIINLDFLKESKIDKHVFMKFNAFKNIGEIQERIGQYFQAKNYYTQVNIAFLWIQCFKLIGYQYRICYQYVYYIDQVDFDDFLLQFTQNCENQQIQILQNSLLDCDTYIPKFAEIFDLLNKDPHFQEQIAESLRIYEDQLIQKEKKLNNLDTVNTSATSNASQPANKPQQNQSYLKGQLKIKQIGSIFLKKSKYQLLIYQYGQKFLLHLSLVNIKDSFNFQYDKFQYIYLKGFTTKRGQAQEKQLQETKRQLRRKVDTTEQQLKQYNLQPLRDFKDFIINEGGFSDLDLEVIFSFNEIYKSKCYLSQESETQNIANGLQMMGLGYDPDGSRLFNNQDCGQERIQAIVETYWKFFEVVEKIQSRGVQYVLRNILRYLIDNPQNSQVFLTFENSSYLYRMFLLSSNNELTNQNLDAIGSFNVILTLFEMSLFNNQVIKHVKSNALITQRDRFYEYFNSKENEYFVILDREQKRLQSENNLDSTLAQQNDVLKIRFYHAMMFYSFEIKNDMHSSIRYYQKIENDTLRRVGKIQIPWVSTSFKIDENKLVQYGSCKIKEAQVVKDYDEALLALKQLLMQYIDHTEKIKEMWNKLQYSLCRCESQTLIRISCHLFSIMKVFNFCFIYGMDYVRTNNYEGIADLKNPLFGFIHNLIYSKDEKDAINQLVKLEVDFLRLLNNEFLYFHIVQNQFRFGDQLLNSYCTSLYIIEMFVKQQVYIPDDDLTVQLRFITKLVKQLDKLCHKNGEIFIRAYFKFLTQVLPFTLSIFMNQYDQTFNPQTLKIKGAINTLRQIQQLNENNDLLQMIIALCQYFYDIKFNTKDIQKAHQSLKILQLINYLLFYQSLDIPNVSKDLNMSSKKFKAGRKDEEIKHNSGKLGDTDMTVPGNSNKKQQQQDQNYDDDEDEEESEEEKKNYRLC